MGESEIKRLYSLEHRSESIMALKMGVFVFGLLLITVGVDSRHKLVKPSLVKRSLAKPLLARTLASFIPASFIPFLHGDVIKCIDKCENPGCYAVCPKSPNGYFLPLGTPVDIGCYVKCDPGLIGCALSCIHKTGFEFPGFGSESESE